jgi:hypothetical protein
MCELPRLLQGQLHLTAHVLQKGLCRRWIGIHQIARELEVDRERDQVLLRTVVKLALDPASVCIVGNSQTLAGRAQLFDLDAQPVEGLLRRLDMRKLR